MHEVIAERMGEPLRHAVVNACGHPYRGRADRHHHAGEKPQPALKRDNILFGLVHMVVFAVFVFMVFVP